jgi:hypothetical protein
VAAAALVALTFHVACDAVFDCGCTWIFAGGEAHCDIQVAGPPDCPPCADWAIGALFAAALFGGWTLALRGLLHLAVRRA